MKGKCPTQGIMRGIPIDGKRLRELLLAKGAKSMRAVCRDMEGTWRDGVSRAIRTNSIDWIMTDRIHRTYGIKLWEYVWDWREIACFYESVSGAS